LFLDRSYTDEQIENLVAETSFKSMKQHPDESFNFLKDVNWFEKDMEFFRKGKTGDWKNHFSGELAQKVEDALARNLKSKNKFNYIQN
jgi:estrone sulfotransferase